MLVVIQIHRVADREIAEVSANVAASLRSALNTPPGENTADAEIDRAGGDDAAAMQVGLPGRIGTLLLTV